MELSTPHELKTCLILAIHLVVYMFHRALTVEDMSHLSEDPKSQDRPYRTRTWWKARKKGPNQPLENTLHLSRFTVRRDLTAIPEKETCLGETCSVHCET